MTAPKPMTRAELTERVAKLANVTQENGATENEAANAAAAMQKLLQQYNLQLADLSADLQARDNPMATEIVMFGSRDHKVTYRGQPWKRELAYKVGSAFFCETLTSPASATFLGTKVDVETAAYTFNFLVNTLDPMARAYTAEYTDKKIAELGFENKSFLRGADHPNVVRNSWLDGAVRTVTKSLNKQAQVFEESSKKAGALVIARQDAAKAYAMEQYKRAYKKKGYTPSDNQTNWDAFADGKDAGEKITVTKGVTAGTAKKTLKLEAPVVVAA